MTRTLEFEMTVERTVLVRAKVNRVHGEPGSLAIQGGWEIDACTATNPQTGETLGLSEGEQQQIEEAVLERAER